MPLKISSLRPVARGVNRPEDVLLLPDGRIGMSDMDFAVALLSSAGELQRIGKAGGSPNGLGSLPGNRVAIANFEHGCLQVLDLETGVVDVVADHTVDGRPLRYANYPLVDATGGVWLSCCSERDIGTALADPAPDGMLAYVEPGGLARKVADVMFPNCMASDPSGDYLYVCRTATSDVVRFPIAGPGVLGPEEPYGPPLGGRLRTEIGPAFTNTARDPAVSARWGLADGCAFDAEGNLWVTLVMSKSLVAITPSQERVDIEVEDGRDLIIAPTSVCWGGADMRDIYIGSLGVDYVVRGRSNVAGLPRFGVQ
jgi:sugar lactone lactonase YvrE